MGQGCPHIPKRGRKAEAFCRAGEGICAAPPPVQLKTHHIAALTTEQLLAARRIRVICAQGVKHARDPGQARKMVRQARRTVLRSVIAQREG